MNISIITTVNHNIGDDFVREGIKYLMRQYFKNQTLHFQNIHKHSPITTRYGFEWFRDLRWSSKIDKIIPKQWSKDRVFEADILIQSGAPVYWCHQIEGGHCYQNEWYTPLIKERFIKQKNTKLLNIAAGTCQKYHSDGHEFCQHCNDYIKEFYEFSDVTTVRDKLAKVVLSKVGANAPLIPCSSIFAIDEHNLTSGGEDYVVMNYMEGGAHYTLGQDINFKNWEDTFKKFYFDLKQKERVIIACHNQTEADKILTLDPNAEIFYRKDDYLPYMKFYAKAKFGIMNRVHGAFLLASYGKPSIVIGNDSRAKMAEEIGLRHYFVNDVDLNLLNHEYELLKNEATCFKEKFQIVKEQAFKDYMKAFSIL